MERQQRSQNLHWLPKNFMKKIYKMCKYFHVISDICIILYLRKVRVQKKTYEKTFCTTYIIVIVSYCI